MAAPPPKRPRARRPASGRRKPAPRERSLGEAELRELRWAYDQLEHPSFAARLSSAIGAPIERAINLLPAAWQQRVDRAAERVVRGVLMAAIASLGKTPSGGQHLLHQIAAAAVGAVGGAFGPVTLFAELPLTTAMMLRAIADIAHGQGEDLSSPEAQMACAEVFALGGRSREDDAADTGYYGLRATLSFHFAPFTLYGHSGADIPAGIHLIRGIAARFGAPISDGVAVKMVPVVGAISGALINLAFMQHFQDVARGHFIVRRLEREFSPEVVRRAYEQIDAESAKAAREFSRIEGW
jgi:hypothetical protein